MTQFSVTRVTSGHRPRERVSDRLRATGSYAQDPSRVRLYRRKVERTCPRREWEDEWGTSYRRQIDGGPAGVITRSYEIDLAGGVLHI